MTAIDFEKFKEKFDAGEYFIDFPDNLKDDPEWALYVVEKDCSYMQNISGRLKGDEDFILKAVQINPEAFKYASDKIRLDKKTVMRVIEKSPKTFFYMPLKMMDDLDVVRLAIRKKLTNTYTFLSTTLRDDKELAVLALKNSCDCYRYFSGRLKCDFELAKIAMTHAGMDFLFLITKFKQNEKLMTLALRSNPKSIQFFPITQRNNRTFIDYALEQDNSNFSHLSIEAQSNPEILLKALSCGSPEVYEMAGLEAKTDLKVLMALMDKDLAYFNITLKNDVNTPVFVRTFAEVKKMLLKDNQENLLNRMTGINSLCEAPSNSIAEEAITGIGTRMLLESMTETTLNKVAKTYDKLMTFSCFEEMLVAEIHRKQILNLDKKQIEKKKSGRKTRIG